MLSVLIVNWNTRDRLRACLLSIRRFPPTSPYEVIVVDNASSDGSAEMVSTEFPEVRLHSNTSNEGYARGNNKACSSASGEWLLTLNPDTEFEDDTLDRSVAKLSSSPGIGALAARLVGDDGETQCSIRGWPSVMGILGDLTGLGKLFPASKLDSYRKTGFDYAREQKAEQPMGTFLLFRREALQAVGDARAPFDESFPIFFNEVDLLYRMHRAGWDCLYSPGVHVLHHGGASTRQVRKSMIWESHRSLSRYMRKHYRTPMNALGLALLSGLLDVAAFVRARGWDAGFRG